MEKNMRDGGESLRPTSIRRGLESLLPVPELTDDDLARVTSAIRKVVEDSELERVGSRSLRIPSKPLVLERIQGHFEDRLIALYRGRLDRAIALMVGVASLVAGGISIFGSIIPREELLGLVVLLVGFVVLNQTIQSGRNGYLEGVQTSRLNDWAASLPTVLVRGHNRVHQAEAELAASARLKRNRRLMEVGIWARPRARSNSAGFDRVQQELVRYAEEVPEGRLQVAISSTKENLDQAVELMREKLGRARQQFFYGNPLQFDILITDDEAIMSLPRSGTDRDLAFRFRNPAVVQELWSVLESQLGENVFVESDRIDAEADIDTVTERLGRCLRPEHCYVDWEQ